MHELVLGSPFPILGSALIWGGEPLLGIPNFVESPMEALPPLRSGWRVGWEGGRRRGGGSWGWYLK